MNWETLLKYCSKDESRGCITEPWIANGRLYATDGRIALRMPVMVDGCVLSVRTGERMEYRRTVGLGDAPREVDDVFPDVEMGVLPRLSVPWDGLPELRYKECEECESPYYAEVGAVCPDCGGRGEVPRMAQFVKLVLPSMEEALFSNVYLHLLRDLKPQWVRVAPHGVAGRARPGNPTGEMMAGFPLGDVVLMGVRFFDVWSGKENPVLATLSLVEVGS